MRAAGGRLGVAGIAALSALAALAACAPRQTAPPVASAPSVTAAAGESPAPDTAAAAVPPGGEGDRRFLVIAVGDSTVTLLAPRTRWVRPGMSGIAVDPRRRDALVGRLSVQARMGDTAVALVTGQTTRMSTDYVAIFRRPPTPVVRQPNFWGGVGAGIVLGALAAVLLFVRD